MPSIGNTWAPAEVGEWGMERKRLREYMETKFLEQRVVFMVHAVYSIHSLSDNCYQLTRTHYVPGTVLTSIHYLFKFS